MSCDALHWCQQHMMWRASSRALLHSLHQDDQNEVQHDFLVMWCDWYQLQSHVTLTALSMTPLHSLGKDDQNEVQNDFLVI